MATSVGLLQTENENGKLPFVCCKWKRKTEVCTVHELCSQTIGEYRLSHSLTKFVNCADVQWHLRLGSHIPSWSCWVGGGLPSVYWSCLSLTQPAGTPGTSAASSPFSGPCWQPRWPPGLLQMPCRPPRSFWIQWANGRLFAPSPFPQGSSTWFPTFFFLHSTRSWSCHGAVPDSSKNLPAYSRDCWHALFPFPNILGAVVRPASL